MTIVKDTCITIFYKLIIDQTQVQLYFSLLQVTYTGFPASAYSVRNFSPPSTLQRNKNNNQGCHYRAPGISPGYYKLGPWLLS